MNTAEAPKAYIREIAADEMAEFEASGFLPDTDLRTMGEVSLGVSRLIFEDAAEFTLELADSLGGEK